MSRESLSPHFPKIQASRFGAFGISVKIIKKVCELEQCLDAQHKFVPTLRFAGLIHISFPGECIRALRGKTALLRKYFEANRFTSRMGCSRRWPAGGPDSTGGTRASQAAIGPRLPWTRSLSAQSCLPRSAAPCTHLDTPKRAPFD